MIETFGRKKGEVWEFYIRNPNSRPIDNIYILPDGGKNNYPSDEQLTADGWLLKINPVGYDVALHNLIKGSFFDNGDNVWQNYEDKPAKTTEEIKAELISGIEKDLRILDSEIDSRTIEDMFDFITGATPDIAQETIDKMTTKKAKRQELKEAKES